MSSVDPLIRRGDVTIVDPLRRFHEFGEPYATWVDEAATTMADDVATQDDATLRRRRSELEAQFETIDPLLLAEEQALRREYEARQAAHLRAVEEYGVLSARAATQFRSEEQKHALSDRVELTAKRRKVDLKAPFLDETSEGVLDAMVVAVAHEQYKNALRGPPGTIDEVFGEPSGFATENEFDDPMGVEDGPPQRVQYVGDYLGTIDWTEGFAEWLAVAREEGMRLAERNQAERAQPAVEAADLDAMAVGAGVRELGVWQTSMGPFEALEGGAIERLVGYDDVSPPSALDELRHLIGPKRAQTLATQLSQTQELQDRSPDEWIRRRRAELGPPDANLDRAAARETLRLEAAQKAARTTLIRALEDQYAFSETDPERAEVAQRTAVAAQRTLDDLTTRLTPRPEEGADIDNWIESDDSRLLRSIMYHDEAVRRWHADAAYLTEFSVVNPPPHVMAVIGDRPEVGGPQRDKYDAVTRKIEMHRMLTESAEQAGLEPPVRSRDEERTLQRQIEQVRRIRGMQSERTAPTEARDLDLG